MTGPRTEGNAAHYCRVLNSQEIEVHVSRRIKSRRVLLGLTEFALARRIGVSQQQVNKYESATDRITAGMLSRIAEALRVKVEYFYEGIDNPGRGPGLWLNGFARSPRFLELSEDFLQIRSRKLREAILYAARALAGDKNGN